MEQIKKELLDSNEDSNVIIFHCKYCSDLIDPYTKPGITCDGECARKIHVHCLTQGRLPTPLVGDVFFDFICKECGEEEQIARAKMSWFKVVVLTLYNLRERSNGISRRGYFHWKSDIVLFIDRNWESLFKKHVKRKKNWIGTISGTLSHHSNTFFLSGTAELGESGWWKLVDNHPPEVLASKNEKAVAERKKPVKTEPESSFKCAMKLNYSPAPSESSISIGEDSNFSLDIGKSQSSAFSQAYVQPTEVLSDFLLTEDDFHDMNSLDIEEGTDFVHSNKIYEPSLVDFINNIKDEQTDISQMPDFSFNDINLEEFSKSHDFEYYNYEYSSDSHCSEDIPSAKKRCPKTDLDNLIENIQVENMEVEEEENEEVSEVQEIVLPSLFNVSKRREWPWKKTENDKQKPVCRPLTVSEELHLLNKFEKYKRHLNSAPASIRRFYRKLVVRKYKRENNLPIFNIDQSSEDSIGVLQKLNKKDNVLSRFMGDIALFEQRLQGNYTPTSIYSPYTKRILLPFIRRDSESKPLWLNLMHELLEKTNKNNPDWSPEPSASIDYSYVRPQHIPAINSLCHQFFWPGIDLTECLQYPDFTCVVLYKKLVIGFAVMVPDVGINEAYISFILTRPEWRNAKIGTFMLYHLIQTCLGKDITLHVSASNPAFFLYQKFGFKLNEFVSNFYDKYMSPDSRESRHALFLRLTP